MITVLAGGVGAARFLQGLVQAVDAEEVTVIVNTGDDVVLHGLYISPDVDTVTYTLAGLSDEERGWGVKDESFRTLSVLNKLGRDTWFNLGDRDMALHIHRTDLMKSDKSLSEVTAQITSTLGVQCRILPMSDQRVETRVITEAGDLGFQEYLVKRGAQDEVKALRFSGAESAEPAPGVIEAITKADGIIVAPSNPLISVGPILAVEGVRDALIACGAPVAAISPIVGGAAIKGPAADMMRGLGMEVSAYKVAELYRDFLGTFILDSVDADQRERVRALGVEPIVTDTIMTDLTKKTALARTCLKAMGLTGR